MLSKKEKELIKQLKEDETLVVAIYPPSNKGEYFIISSGKFNLYCRMVK
ncbi:MAG: hypothetical protein ACE5KE_00545 [Methanosarcinales archaeon]